MSFILTWLLRSLIFRIPGVRIFVGALGLIIALQVFLYIALALGLYRMAKRQKIRGAIFAWIPVAQFYVLGEIADRGAGKGLYALMLPLLAAGALIFACVFASWDPSSGFFWAWITVVLLVVLLVYYFMALRWIYAQYTKAWTALLVLSIIFFFLAPIFIFALSRKDPKPLTARAAVRRKRDG